METYVLGFTVFDARGLVTPSGGPCDPFCVVECCGKRYQTEIKVNRATIVTWNENFIWSDIELYREQFKSAYVTFSIYARNWFTRNDCIGRCSLQLENIRNRRNHLYAKKWLTLREDDESEPKGTVKLTVFCLRPGDPAPSADQQEADDDEAEEGGGEDYEDLSKAVLGGKVEGSGGKPHHVLVTIHRVEDLPASEGWLSNGVNPFVSVEFAGACIKTSLAKNVTQHTFNETIRLPVMTPVFEDTIVLKLWNFNALSPDDLLAQGLLSFSELRNKPMLPQWFNFYGWDPGEIIDVSEITKTGEKLEPNFYRGKLLVSARVDRLDSSDKMEDAGKCVARTSEEPPQEQIVLLCDVYTVHGAVGRECSVEVTIGIKKESTAWIYPSEEDSGKSDETQAVEQTSIFRYSETDGRFAPLLVMVPEDKKSQPDVIVNVYTRGVMSSKTRIGYAIVELSKVPQYDMGNPAVPMFLALNPMPWNSVQRHPASCLLTIEHFLSDDVQRHHRKQIRAMNYCIRVYVFMARRIRNQNDAEPNYFVRVSCTGSVSETKIRKEQRPIFMQCVELSVTLMCDHPKKPPTLEPITVHLCNDEGVFNKVDIGKAVCRYTYLRRKNVLQKWEPFDHRPQWVELYGGKYNSLKVGEILLSFELLRKKDAPELLPAHMYPVPEDSFDASLHLTKLKKATLHFSLLGLRNLHAISSLGGMVKSSVSNPIVEIRVRKLMQPQEGNSKNTDADEFFSIRIPWTKLKADGDENKQEDKNKRWETKRGSNFQFLRCGILPIIIPDLLVFAPVAQIRVFDKGALSESLVGDCQLCLGEKYPWLTGRKEWEDNMIATNYKEQSEEQRNEALDLIRDVEVSKRKTAFPPNQTALEELNSQALPLAFQRATRRRQPLLLKETDLNMKVARSHDDTRKVDPLVAQGEKMHRAGDGGGRPEVEGKLEDSAEKPFESDFWYSNIPLTRGLEIHPKAKVESAYVPRVYGFAKVVLKLVEGWDKVPDLNSSKLDEDNNDGPKELEERSEEPAPRRETLNFPPALNEFAFDEVKFRHRYKSRDCIPSRLRVRVYFVKGVCIYGKGAGFADPYLEFQMGAKIFVSMRNMYQVQTNTPAFYRLEERDIILPDEGELEISLRDYDDVLGFDAIIGSTTIDLEDRWGSRAWREAMDKEQIPCENRGLWTIDAPGQSRGTLEMWVEMLDSVRASDLMASDLRAPPAEEIEVRIVIWTTRNVRMVDGDHTDVMISSSLDCQEYLGSYPAYQETDVHFNCTDGNAVFNWRILYPRIKMPTKSAVLQLSLWDANGLASNVFIGDVNLDLKKYVEKVAKDADAISLTKKELKFSNQAEEEDKPDLEIGYVNVSMWVMTQSEAAANEVGIARDEPNVDPQLITPIEGRGWGDFFGAMGLGFTLPNFGLMGKLIPLMFVFLVCLVVLKYVGLL
eukprot:GEMP01002257.1.p1 GENE.GEMP01002257.1~~GEMP01002257.1.p1  ORF type:complete len:1429 (+),score=308.39 GEMP01002257.1:138-4424(+)